jgi:hypothetical protein
MTWFGILVMKGGIQAVPLNRRSRRDARTESQVVQGSLPLNRDGLIELALGQRLHRRACGNHHDKYWKRGQTFRRICLIASRPGIIVTDLKFTSASPDRRLSSGGRMVRVQKRRQNDRSTAVILRSVRIAPSNGRC